MQSTPISPRADVVVATSQARVTPSPPRTHFKEVLAGAAVKSAEAAMRVLPGTPLMAVAVRGGGLGTAPLGTAGAPMVRSLPEGPGAQNASSPRAMADGVAGAAGSAALGGAAGGDAPGIEASLQQSQDMNLYYLQVQEAVNAQNRSFTVLSNVLKAEHDTVKTAIGNIR